MTLTTAATTTVTHHITLHRDVHASRAEVWRAFTDGESLAAWFAPAGFHVPSRSVRLEPVPGGMHRLTMVHTRDRQLRTDVDARYVSVDPGHGFVVEEDLHDGHPAMTLVVRLTDTPGGCHVELAQGPYAEHMLVPAERGWASSLDKLDAYLAGDLVDDEL